jgi:DNA-binding phage protein
VAAIKAHKTVISANPNNSGLTLNTVKMPTTRNYHAYLIESLQDPQEAAAYLDAVLEECNHDELLLALRNVAEAQLACANPAHPALPPDLVQTLLSPPANVDLALLLQAFSQLGFKLSVTTIERAA